MLKVVQTQPGQGLIDHPIAFSRRKLSTTENNYTMTEREGLAMVYNGGESWYANLNDSRLSRLPD